jgi:hypothetical protein
MSDAHDEGPAAPRDARCTHDRLTQARGWRLISSPEHLHVEVGCPREKEDVATIALQVALELGQGEVVGIECRHSQVAPRGRLDWRQARFVSVGALRNGHDVDVEPVLLVQR